MKYYIKQTKKNNFYYLGEQKENTFKEGMGLKFIKQYLSEYPNMVNLIEVVDSFGNEMLFNEFISIKNNGEISKIKNRIKTLEREILEGKGKNKNHLDGWTMNGFKKQLKDLKEKLKKLENK